MAAAPCLKAPIGALQGAHLACGLLEKRFASRAGLPEGSTPKHTVGMFQQADSQLLWAAWLDYVVLINLIWSSICATGSRGYRQSYRQEYHPQVQRTTPYAVRAPCTGCYKYSTTARYRTNAQERFGDKGEKGGPLARNVWPEQRDEVHQLCSQMGRQRGSLREDGNSWPTQANGRWPAGDWQGLSGR
jgi:hypothetical protein